jgi:hypothetical protein
MFPEAFLALCTCPRSTFSHRIFLTPLAIAFATSSSPRYFPD